MRILLCGDSHGDNRYMSTVILKLSQRYNADALVQLGDFGYGEDDPEGVLYLDKTESKLVQVGLNLYWLDGNHDNHPMLWERYGNEGLVEVRPHIFYLPRGYRWEWEGVTFLACGGAFSVDKGASLASEAMREAPGTEWWPTETITDEQVERCIAGGPVDVILSHDSPWGVPIRFIRPAIWEADDNRKQLAKIVKHTIPKRLYHGHYHQVVRGDFDSPYELDGHLDWNRTKVLGLDMQGRHGSVVVLDLPLDEE